MASIQTLAPSVAEELRASLVLNSLEQCATELVQNSVDANASFIEVKIDVAGHSIQVSDNGHGITAADMERVGARYATSKCSTLQDLKRITSYGFRGEAIAAMTEMSLVDIVSRPRNQKRVFSTIFKGGDRLFCGPSGKYPRYNHGTTVSVRDLFYKFPVRQRYWSEAPGSKLDLELDRVKRAIETLALISPHISFTVIDLNKNTKLFTCRKADSQLHRMTAVFGQALCSSMTFVKSAHDPTYSFSGYISTLGHNNRLYQFIFLNTRPVQCERLQKAIIQVFQQSNFSKDSLSYDKDVRRSKERHPVFVLTLKCPASEYDVCADPSKVNVEFEEEERVLYIVRDTIVTFLERQHLLSRSVASALRIQTTTRKRKLRAQSGGGFAGVAVPLGHFSRVKSSRPSRAAGALQNNQVIDRGCCPLEELDVEDELEFELDAEWMACMLDDDFISNEIEFRRQDDSGIMVPSSMSDRCCSTRTIRASLPHTVGPRTRPFNTGTSGIWAQDALRKWVNPVFPTPPSHVPSLQTLSLDASDTDQGESIEKSVSRFFSAGGSQEGDFDAKSLQLSKSCLQHACVIAQLDHKFILCTMDASSSTTQPGSGDGSKVLVVIDQHAADERVRVERLMKEMCTCSSGPTVSSILDPTGVIQGTGYQEVEHRLDSMTMIPPLPITLSRREWKLAQQYSDWLHRWGIILDRSMPSADKHAQHTAAGSSLGSDVDEELADTVMISHHFSDGICGSTNVAPGPAGPTLVPQQESFDPQNRLVLAPAQAAESDYFQGYVTALPRVVADRCVLDMVLTQDLMKDSISWAEEGRSGSTHIRSRTDTPSGDASTWLRCIRGCPRGILDIVNSKACRGAIMFNDELSVVECEEVVRSLSRCSFPFQCAHGRPSIVPLTMLNRTEQREQEERHEGQRMQQVQKQRQSGSSAHPRTHLFPTVGSSDSTRWSQWMRGAC